MPGSADFVTEINNKYLQKKSIDRNLPALKKLATKPSLDSLLLNASCGQILVYLRRLGYNCVQNIFLIQVGRIDFFATQPQPRQR